MKFEFSFAPLIFAALFACSFLGCGASVDELPSTPSIAEAKQWLGIPSAVNQVVQSVYEGTGWLLDKHKVDIKKVSEVRSIGTDGEHVADFEIRVEVRKESFQTTALNVPCDADGIPTEDSIDRLKSSIEEIKAKIKRLQQ